MKNKKTVITVISIVAVLLVIIGVTYAYWLVTKTQTNQNVISSGCLDISLTGEKNDITLTDQFPLSDEDGMELTPYEFTVTNNCTTSVDYQVNLESIGEEATAIKASAIKVALNDEIKQLTTGGNVEPTLSEAYESNMILYGTLAGSSEETEEDTVTYELRIWIDADAPISEQNKTFQSKISVTIGQGVTNPYKEGTLAYSILSNYGGVGEIGEITDFSVGSTASDAGLYKAQDDMGTSYYFRGAPTNNYVKFGTYAKDTTLILMDSGGVDTKEVTVAAGTPMYWRIVRINGDGTVRMIYDGTSPVANGVAHTATIAQTSYNNVNYDAAKYVGYTYDVNGTETDSTIKGVVDDWYEDHLKGTYEKYIADSIFCNDREITDYSEPYYDSWDGAGPYVDVYYATYSRLVDNKIPELTCTNKSDRYTTSDKKGNGLLSNPVGLLTADEAFLAGGTTLSNKTYYLYSNERYWISTPHTFIDMFNFPNVWSVAIDGCLATDDVGYGLVSARPVINLKADVKFAGDGRIDTNSPYEIVME